MTQNLLTADEAKVLERLSRKGGEARAFLWILLAFIAFFRFPQPYEEIFLLVVVLTMWLEIFLGRRLLRKARPLFGRLRSLKADTKTGGAESDSAT